MSSRTITPSPRRSPPSVPPSSPPSVSKGATARSAASPRISSSLNSSVTRRQSLKSTPSSQTNGEIRESRESLSSSLKLETDKKEQLLVQLQNKDHTIGSLSSENNNLSSALSLAETRLNELYADQSRMEDEMAARIEVSEKLREQVRELEKEKREVQRRYNEQTSTFEAERQAFYDNEQHLKSRIQSLMQARKPPELTFPVAEDEPEDELEDEDDHHTRDLPQSPEQNLNDPETEPAEMTSLRLELSTLSTSYASLQSTLVLLQTQLFDLTRVNRELQEENESYMILLREKTLSGQFDLLKQVGGSQGSSEDGDDDENEDGTDADESVDVGSLKSIGRSTLDRVDEMPEDSLEQELERSLQPGDTDSVSSMPTSRHQSRHARKRGTTTSPSPRGESLAGLPITGPGLDLAAELGRAENKDILAGNSFGSPDRSAVDGKGKKSKKDARKPSTAEAAQGLEPSGPLNDIDALRTEVKALKDANKALSLYASKIIDRIISQEGFEHVLAVDYTPSTTSPVDKPALPEKSPAKVQKARPQSVMVARSTSSPMPSLDSFKFGSSPQTAVPKAPAAAPTIAPTSKANRRSLSFDWKSFSMFGGNEKKPENTNLRPLTLKPGSTTVTSARKLETVEDENDKRERERLHATMKLMGIDKPAPSPLVAPSALMQKSASSPAPSSTLPTVTQSRFSFFRSRSTTTNSETSSLNSTHSINNNNSRVGLGIDAPGLTTEALAQAEAEESLAALDAHERALSAEIARGASGGFTEILPRSGLGDGRSRRNRKSGGSGSTVWSAGMGKAEDEFNPS